MNPTGYDAGDDEGEVISTQARSSLIETNDHLHSIGRKPGPIQDTENRVVAFEYLTNLCVTS